MRTQYMTPQNESMSLPLKREGAVRSNQSLKRPGALVT